MRVKKLLEDFVIEEELHVPGDKGAYAYYRVEKEGVSTTSVREHMAARLKVTPSALVFPAAKDIRAVAVQYASIRKRGPQQIEGPGYAARRVGMGPRALRLTDLGRNRFTIVARDLSNDGVKRLGPALESLGLHGLPNYFGDPRFGSRARRDFIGKEILKRDAERVVHMYLAERLASDSRGTRAFKRLVSTHWGQWGYLLHQAPRPSNFRSVITFLKDNPHDYRKAANLIQDRLLSIYLAEYQAWVWNLIVAQYLEDRGLAPHTITISRTPFPLPNPDPDIAALCDVAIDLPRLTAHYRDRFAEAAARALEGEGLDIRDFKARILRRVYLMKDERTIAFIPQDVACGAPEDDELYPGRRKVALSFALPPGHYATLVVKAAAVLIGAEMRTRTSPRTRASTQPGR